MKFYLIPFFAKQILTKKNSVKFNNIKNGLYVFSVAAIDKVGNIGEASTIEILLNKKSPMAIFY